MCVAGAGKRLGDEAQIGDSAVEITLVPLKESAIVECTRVVGIKFEGLAEVRSRVLVLLPLNFDDGLVGKRVDVVRAKFRDMCEGVDLGSVLLRVQQAYAVVVPSHPFVVL